MVGVVNPSSDQTLEKFTSSAKSASSNVSPDAPFGGTLVKSTSTSSTTGSSPTQTKAGAAGHLSASLLAIAGVAAGAAAFLM